MDSSMKTSGQGEASPIPTLRVLVPSPIGPLGLELAGLSVVRLQVAPKPAVLEEFKPLGRSAAPDEVDEVIGRLAEYFAGVRRSLDLDADLALERVDAFDRRVLREVTRIPYGKTRTYRELAVLVGRSDGADAVRSLLLENPAPIVIPCHRVVLGGGKPGAWVGGSERKRWLLAMEREAHDEE
jgi:methylated-DNA-[protein]-cysteine S-methyltransferase